MSWSHYFSKSNNFELKYLSKTVLNGLISKFSWTNRYRKTNSAVKLGFWRFFPCTLTFLDVARCYFLFWWWFRSFDVYKMYGMLWLVRCKWWYVLSLQMCKHLTIIDRVSSLGSWTANFILDKIMYLYFTSIEFSIQLKLPNLDAKCTPYWVNFYHHQERGLGPSEILVKTQCTVPREMKSWLKWDSEMVFSFTRLINGHPALIHISCLVCAFNVCCINFEFNLIISFVSGLIETTHSIANGHTHTHNAQAQAPIMFSLNGQPNELNWNRPKGCTVYTVYYINDKQMNK